MDLKEKYSTALYAAIVGDAQCVPEESSAGQEKALCSVKNLFGYGRFDQPQGTWSDDTSMILCTMDSLSRGYNLEDLSKTFCSWLFEGKWTPFGFVFDAGLTTVTALESIRSDMKSPLKSGCTSDDDNGNGSVMRILPAALYFSRESIDNFLSKIYEISAITHAHPRSIIGCSLYALLVRKLLETDNKNEAYTATMDIIREYFSKKPLFSNELRHYDRLLSHEIITATKENIDTSGYIVDTIETAIWSFMNYNTTREVLLSAVNLGLDTDTSGSLAGGLAGIVHGLESIPEVWITTLALKNDLDKLIHNFITAALK